MAKDSPDKLPDTGFLRLAQVLELIPVSKTTWWDGVKEKTLPAARQDRPQNNRVARGGHPRLHHLLGHRAEMSEDRMTSALCGSHAQGVHPDVHPSTRVHPEAISDPSILKEIGSSTPIKPPAAKPPFSQWLRCRGENGIST